MNPIKTTLAILGMGLFLAVAPQGWGQTREPLEYSRMSMALAHGKPDTLHIHNPNASALRCDSVVLLLENLDLGGLLLFWSGGVGVTAVNNQLYFRSPTPIPDPGSGGYRIVVRYDEDISSPGFKLDFPAGRTVEFVWRGYDPCPVCKRSAAPASADSAHFRMVLHVGGRADTLRMAIDRPMTVGIAPPSGGRPAPARSRRASHFRDPLGRLQAYQERPVVAVLPEGRKSGIPPSR